MNVLDEYNRLYSDLTSLSVIAEMLAERDNPEIAIAIRKIRNSAAVLQHATGPARIVAAENLLEATDQMESLIDVR